MDNTYPELFHIKNYSKKRLKKVRNFLRNNLLDIVELIIDEEGVLVSLVICPAGASEAMRMEGMIKHKINMTWRYLYTPPIKRVKRALRMVRSWETCNLRDGDLRGCEKLFINQDTKNLKIMYEAVTDIWQRVKDSSELFRKVTENIDLESGGLLEEDLGFIPKGVRVSDIPEACIRTYAWFRKYRDISPALTFVKYNPSIEQTDIKIYGYDRVSKYEKALIKKAQTVQEILKEAVESYEKDIVPLMKNKNPALGDKITKVNKVIKDLDMIN